MSKLLFLKSVETLVDACDWKEELCGQINERIIFASIDCRDDAEREEYRLLCEDLRFAFHQADKAKVIVEKRQRRGYIQIAFIF